MEAIRKASPRRRFRLGWILIQLVLLSIAGFFAFMSLSADRQLKEAIAEADRLDPGWRLEELEAKRQPVSAAENSADIVLAAHKLLPNPWPIHDWQKAAPCADPLKTPAQVRLDDKQIRALTLELESAERALVIARRLADYRWGRYHLTWSEDGSAPAPHVESIWEVGRMLSYDAVLRAEEGDIDGALTSCCAAVNAARSIGDEPNAWQLSIGARSNTLSIDRLLAHGTASAQALTSLQHVLELEEAVPVLLIAARTSRALGDKFNIYLLTRKISGEDRLGIDFSHKRRPQPLSLAWSLLNTPTQNRAELLHFNTRFVEIAKLPVEEQMPLCIELEASLEGKSSVVLLLAPDAVELADAYRRSQALLRCAICMLAVERYRLDHKRWPSSLAELVPVYLKRIPADPYDGAALRYRLVPDGVAIYSLGPDGKDHGRVIQREWGKTGGNLGFRLWDVSRRRQPPTGR